MIKAQRGKDTALGLRRDPVFIVLTAFMTVVLILFVVYPVFSVLIKSFTSDGGFSVSNYGDFFRFSYYPDSALTYGG